MFTTRKDAQTVLINKLFVALNFRMLATVLSLCTSEPLRLLLRMFDEQAVTETLGPRVLCVMLYIEFLSVSLCKYIGIQK
jgi:hypothetical protein